MYCSFFPDYLGMGKAEVEAWIASTSSGSGEYDESLRPGLPEWHREAVLKDWAQALQVAQKRLLTSSTKSRVQFLKEELLFLAKHAGKSTMYFTLIGAYVGYRSLFIADTRYIQTFDPDVYSICGYYLERSGRRGWR